MNDDSQELNWTKCYGNEHCCLDKLLKHSSLKYFLISRFNNPVVHVFFCHIHGQKELIGTYGMKLEEEHFQVGSLLDDFYQH